MAAVTIEQASSVDAVPKGVPISASMAAAMLRSFNGAGELSIPR